MKEVLQQSYNHQAVVRDGLEKDLWKVIERDVFLTRLKEHGARTLLEIGAGTGQDSLFFQESGLAVTATDMSSEMVRLCKAKDLHAIQMDFYNLNFPPNQFDATWALNCLLHVPKRDLSTVLAGICDVLKPGGLFYVGVYGGDDSEGIWQDDRYEPKRFFSFHTDASIQASLREHFHIRYFKSIDSWGPNLHFQSVIVQKPSTENQVKS